MFRLHDHPFSPDTASTVLQYSLHRNIPAAIRRSDLHEPLHILVFGVTTEEIKEKPLKSVVI